MHEDVGRNVISLYILSTRSGHSGDRCPHLIILLRHMIATARNRFALRERQPAYSVDLAMDCVRGLAALWVFLFHMRDIVAESFPHILLLAKAGTRGVPIFFAVSGYCIYAAAERCRRDGTDGARFLRRRLWRIFPTFWLSLIVVLCLPYVMEAIASLKTGHFHWPEPRWFQYGLSDWIGVVSLSNDLFDNVRSSRDGFTLVNAVYWTLGIELQFYLVMVAAIRLRQYRMWFLGGVTVAGILASLLPAFQLHGFFLHYWPAFAAGAVVRFAHSHGWTTRALFGRHEWSASMAMLLSAGVLLASWLKSGQQVSFMGAALLGAVLVWILGGVENGAVGHERLGSLLRKAVVPFVALGHASYSVYLLHGKLFQLPDMFVRQVIPASSPLYLVTVMTATVVLCYVFYLVVERRFKSPSKRAPAQAGAPVGHEPLTGSAAEPAA